MDTQMKVMLASPWKPSALLQSQSNGSSAQVTGATVAVYFQWQCPMQMKAFCVPSPYLLIYALFTRLYV